MVSSATLLASSAIRFASGLSSWFFSTCWRTAIRRSAGSGGGGGAGWTGTTLATSSLGGSGLGGAFAWRGGSAFCGFRGGGSALVGSGFCCGSGGASSSGSPSGDRSGGASGAGGGVAATPSVSTSNVVSAGRRPSRTAWTIRRSCARSSMTCATSTAPPPPAMCATIAAQTHRASGMWAASRDMVLSASAPQRPHRAMWRSRNSSERRSPVAPPDSA
ncbi:hypothetical protein SCE1572_17645 [Sorangium cellulosum So0157-2]|uniref:Uncharacterized protein n=1 Tax=Sorangium cellulosum So0157-2 TaxID=1254432 RepID=S4XUY1_SORCE|nr:hypothetical protein SCE1572_17645 [Sorangium cellulosum So0157-2]